MTTTRERHNPEVLCQLAIRNKSKDDVTAVIITRQEAKASSPLYNLFFKKTNSTGSLSSSSEEFADAQEEENKRIMKVPL